MSSKGSGLGLAGDGFAVGRLGGGLRGPDPEDLIVSLGMHVDLRFSITVFLKTREKFRDDVTLVLIDETFDTVISILCVDRTF